MEDTQRIVVGYDAGPDADLALTWAIGTARRQQRPLVVQIATSAMDPVLIKSFHQETERLAARWRARAEKVLADAGVTDATVRVDHGPTLRVLLTAVRSGDLLVVGSTGHAPFVETVGGSVSQHLARHARCPVVVVRPAHLPDAGRIVVGVDGSAESIAALAFACARARDTGEEVLVVHGYRAHPFGRPDLAEQVAEQLAGWTAPARAAYPDVAITEKAVEEPAHRLLADLSASASLLVVGSRGRDAFADLLLGSVTQDALHRARCPVAVVR